MKGQPPHKQVARRAYANGSEGQLATMGACNVFLPSLPKGIAIIFGKFVCPACVLGRWTGVPLCLSGQKTDTIMLSFCLFGTVTIFIAL